MSPRHTIAAGLVLGLVLGLPGVSSAAPAEATVAELIAQLPKCQGLESCHATVELARRGESVWPELAAGLKAADEMTRFWTLGVLTKVPVVAAREAIAARLDDDAIRVRAAAAFALGEQKDKAVTPWLLEALADKDLNVRFAAAEALTKVRDPAALDALIGACRDKDEDVRAHAALALGYLGDTRATPALLERLDQDIKPIVRGYAAVALGHLRDEAALKPLLARVSEEKDVQALAAAVGALGELRDVRALPALQKLTEHAEARVVEHARYAIAVIQDHLKPKPKAAPARDGGGGRE